MRDRFVMFARPFRLLSLLLLSLAPSPILAGSTVVEDSVIMGVAVLTTGHLTIGAGLILLALVVVTKDVPRGGRVGGFPAQDVGAWRREIATLRLLSKGKKSGREN